MDVYGWPILFALVFWWTSTIVILVLNGLPSRTYPVSLAALTILAIVAMYGMGVTSRNASLAGVYCAFASGLAAWGWQIATFYMGAITGPQREACPAHLRGWQRFVAAVRTCLHHELAILLMAIAIYMSVRGETNQFGAWTFLVLWWMHMSAKLNVHFGVRNLGEQFLNPRMRYLVTFMTRRPMNAFFPVSVTISTIVTVVLAEKALRDGAQPYEAAGYTMLATLMALAIVEHWLLVTPFEADVLWKWGVQREPAAGKIRAIEPERPAARSAVVAANSDDSDYQRPPIGVPSALPSWCASPPNVCDPAGLKTLLCSLAAENSATSKASKAW